MHVLFEKYTIVYTCCMFGHLSHVWHVLPHTLVSSVEDELVARVLILDVYGTECPQSSGFAEEVRITVL